MEGYPATTPDIHPFLFFFFFFLKDIHLFLFLGKRTVGVGGHFLSNFCRGKFKLNLWFPLQETLLMARNWLDLHYSQTHVLETLLPLSQTQLSLLSSSLLFSILFYVYLCFSYMYSVINVKIYVLMEKKRWGKTKSNRAISHLRRVSIFAWSLLL